ncbi:M13 family metallopeptidase [Mycoplasmopsis anatis]|uniref:Neutral endopeptidase (Endopeptidase O) n=1 Tax=Mycoplasmopsis anatis 1340 TaxID=1034808 RepID=F9QD95_9BACT|nr:M13 family metallopeptidase [Mycoplasmopsis anatis]EGS29353.1 neutral endopeptidase (Endopeptidase O) [Mycoplasmopsis anatis 1340]VEU74150.1 Neutral endopeptidase [Mycoplasmopsis anatis]
MSKNSLKNDFFNYINQEWLEKTQIPSDRPAISGFGELDLAIEKLTIDLTLGFADGSKQMPNDKYIKEYIKLFKKFYDAEQRNKISYEPVHKILSKIEKLSSFEELNKNYLEFQKYFSYLPVDFGVAEDMKNSKINVLWAETPNLILPDKTDYENVENRDKKLNAWKSMTRKLLNKYGKNDLEIEKLLEDTIKFDSLLIESAKNSVEYAQYTKLYNPLTPNEVKKYFVGFDFMSHASKLVQNKEIDKIIFPNEKIFPVFKDIFNEHNFELYKSAFLVFNLLKLTPYLDEESRIISGEFSRFLSGTKEAKSLTKYAMNSSLSYYSIPFGIYYAKTYFGEENKREVEKMIQEMIQVYKERLETNSWLEPQTIEKALEKLNKIEYMVAYPEELQPVYDHLIVDEDKSLVENVLEFNSIRNEFNFKKYLEETNPKYWSMSPATVNAYYNPMKNHIVFPAAILSYPFYSPKNSSAANFGGIGAVIAHEISHAFDNNGSQFDSEGNLNNWWTENDLEKFNKKIEHIIRLFDGREVISGEKCNGTLTASENIADCGGFQCAYEAASRRSDFNRKDFFESWARIWRFKSSDEYIKLLLSTDVHAPAKLRANVHLMNSPQFQEEYGISENDQMYLSKDEMLEIW